MGSELKLYCCMNSDGSNEPQLGSVWEAQLGSEGVLAQLNWLDSALGSAQLSGSAFVRGSGWVGDGYPFANGFNFNPKEFIGSSQPYLLRFSGSDLRSMKPDHTEPSLVWWRRSEHAGVSANDGEVV